MRSYRLPTAALTLLIAAIFLVPGASATGAPPCTGNACVWIQGGVGSHATIHWTNGSVTVPTDINVNGSTSLVLSHANVTSSGKAFNLHTNNTVKNCDLAGIGAFRASQITSVMVVANDSSITNMKLSLPLASCTPYEGMTGNASFVFVANSSVPGSWLSTGLSTGAAVGGIGSIVSHVIVGWGIDVQEGQPYTFGGASHEMTLPNGAHAWVPIMNVMTKEVNVTVNGVTYLTMANPTNLSGLNTLNQIALNRSVSVNVTVLAQDQIRVDVSHQTANNMTLDFPTVVGKMYHFTVVNDTTGATVFQKWANATSVKTTVIFNTTAWGTDPTFTFASNSTGNSTGIGTTTFYGLTSTEWVIIGSIIVVLAAVIFVIYYTMHHKRWWKSL